MDRKKVTIFTFESILVYVIADRGQQDKVEVGEAGTFNQEHFKVLKCYNYIATCKVTHTLNINIVHSIQFCEIYSLQRNNSLP